MTKKEMDKRKMSRSGYKKKVRRELENELNSDDDYFKYLRIKTDEEEEQLRRTNRTIRRRASKERKRRRQLEKRMNPKKQKDEKEGIDDEDEEETCKKFQDWNFRSDTDEDDRDFDPSQTPRRTHESSRQQPIQVGRD